MERRCTACLEIVGEDDTYCPHCGERLASAWATWPTAVPQSPPAPETRVDPSPPSQSHPEPLAATPPEPPSRPGPPPASQEIVPLQVPVPTPEPLPDPEPPRQGQESQEIVPLRVSASPTSPVGRVRRILRRLRHGHLRSHQIP